MLNFELERKFAYKFLGRWIEKFKDDYSSRPKIADLLLSRALVIEKEGNARFASPEEYEAALVLYYIETIIACIETGEAKELLDDVPILTHLLEELNQHLATLAKITGHEIDWRKLPEGAIRHSETMLGRREQQYQVILAEIVKLKFDPMEIPNSGKSTIKTACLNHRELFTADGFDHAWKAGRKENQFRMANHKNFISSS